MVTRIRLTSSNNATAVNNHRGSQDPPTHYACYNSVTIVVLDGKDDNGQIEYYYWDSTDPAKRKIVKILPYKPFKKKEKYVSLF